MFKFLFMTVFLMGVSCFSQSVPLQVGTTALFQRQDAQTTHAVYKVTIKEVYSDRVRVEPVGWAYGVIQSEYYPSSWLIPYQPVASADIKAHFWSDKITVSVGNTVLIRSFTGSIYKAVVRDLASGYVRVEPIGYAYGIIQEVYYPPETIVSVVAP